MSAALGSIGMLGAFAYHWAELTPERKEIQRIKLQSINSLTWVIFQLRIVFPVETRTQQQNVMIAQACYEAAMLANEYDYQGHYAFVLAEPKDNDDFLIQDGKDQL